MSAYYDSGTKEIIVVLDGQRLTIPDYMTIQDIEYFLQDKLIANTTHWMQQATYHEEQTTPLEKARQHYKDLGWFKTENDNNMRPD